MSQQSSLKHHFAPHLQAWSASLQQLYRTPFSSLMTFAVIGIAFALPLCFLVILQNAAWVAKQWQNGTQISLFLKQELGDTDIQALQEEIKTRPAIATVSYISPQQGLQELVQAGAMNEILSQLPNNPLPPVLVVTPRGDADTPEQVDDLVKELRELHGVESAKLDMQWVRRLFAMIDVMEHLVWGLMALLIAAVLLIIGNTIRLATHERRKEIEILQLIGASNRFIRRPFLYSGVTYGIGGGVLAWLLVIIFILFLSDPVAHLASLYHTHFHLHQLPLTNGLLLLAVAAALGWVGSWGAVTRYLRLH